MVSSFLLSSFTLWFNNSIFTRALIGTQSFLKVEGRPQGQFLDQPETGSGHSCPHPVLGPVSATWTKHSRSNRKLRLYRVNKERFISFVSFHFIHLFIYFTFLCISHYFLFKNFYCYSITVDAFSPHTSTPSQPNPFPPPPPLSTN